MTVTDQRALEDKIASSTQHDGPVVQIRNVSKTFGDPISGLHVLSNVNQEVARGEVVSIVGPSGCGKTTLLRMIQGLEPISSGEILIENQPVGSGEVDAGFVFQHPSLYPWFTVRRNIAFGVQLRARAGKGTKEEKRRRVEELLQLVGLGEFGDYRPHQLSGGMQQRANLARALAIDPAVLLLDEPFSAVHTLTRERLQRVLSELLGEIKTQRVLVTHDIREAVFLGSRVVVMGGSKPGGIIAEHRVDEPFPRTERFQHSAELGEIGHLVYEDLKQTNYADVVGTAVVSLPTKSQDDRPTEQDSWSVSNLNRQGE